MTDVFVYGTLRPGQYNDGRSGLSSQATEVINNVRTDGRMWNVAPGNPIYPVVNFDLAGDIIGDLLIGIPDDSQILKNVHLMEVGAGYELRTVRVYISGDDNMEGWHEAIAYHYDSNQRGLRLGQRIENGDWLAFDQAYEDWKAANEQ